MPDLFTLTNDVKAITANAIDSLINQLGKACKLIYPPKMVPCGNCIADNVGMKSSNRWLSGGPLPFPDGSLCPLCNGKGFEAQEISESIKLLVTWNPKKFDYPLLQEKPGVQLVEVPAGTIQTKGFLSDMPRILQSRQLIVQTDIEGMNRYRFFLWGEPVDVSNIVQARYCVALWSRNGG